MAVSFNSFTGFSLTAKYRHVPRSKSPSEIYKSRLLVTNIVTENKDSDSDSDSPLDSPLKDNPKPIQKRSRLTAREKLKAARVLSRNSEARQYKKEELGSKVLAVMRESERGKKRSGLPEAPTNLFDDSKRGMPKKGLTWELPGGTDVFLIIFSVVFISTVMFTTTYIVWKLGAIHFNEY